MNGIAGFFSSSSNLQSAGQALSVGSSFGANLGSALSVGQFDRVADAQESAIRQSASIQARRTSRVVQAQQAQAIAAIGANGGQHGSNVFIMAQNARNAEERRQSVLVEAETQIASIRASRPIPQSGLSLLLQGASSALSIGNTVQRSSST